MSIASSFKRSLAAFLAGTALFSLTGCSCGSIEFKTVIATLPSASAVTTSVTVSSSASSASVTAEVTATSASSVTSSASSGAVSSTETSETSASATETAASSTVVSTSVSATSATSAAISNQSFAEQVAQYDPDSLIPLTGTTLADGVTAEEAAAWFKDTVFIGDSVTMGFRNYIMYQQQLGYTDCMGAPLFVVSGSLSARAALEPISEDSLHPLYKGKKRLIEDVVAEVDAKRIFIQLGLNEIAIDGVEAPLDYLTKLIARIKAQSPDVEIYLISTTYMVEGSEKKKLNNPNIRQLNYNRMKYAVDNGYGYIDVANNICDENGYLFSEYSSDQYVHQVNVSYAIWEKVFLSYASYRIAEQ